MFDRVLIANRGEIAVRVIRTCRGLGIATVAVYSDADARAMHVEIADAAIHIGPAPATESYLDIDAVIAAARDSGAQAIHPGYGFLSENAAFGRACAKAGIVFIGPPPDAIDAMGSKSAAKALMEKAGVPILPGHHGDKQDDATLKKAAGKVGFPVLIKPSAGGGGRGMRLVESAADMDEALASARREAASSFGDDRLLIERYLARPRHVEVQVFGDSQGNVIHLFERDCSVQRRHQKVLEEAPAPGMTTEMRTAMGVAAVAAAKAIDYTGAGTVEFLLADDNSFYFMEMNTRLQVEHPVTEMITGLDLVEWQLRIAAGEALPLAQTDVPLNGHAIEARLYAEDPAAGFVPSAGTLHHLRLPNESEAVRVDTGVREGDTVSPFYDPMIAKVIVHASDRSGALERLRRALSAVQVAGLKTNAAFLSAVAANDEFAAARLHTGLIDANQESLLTPDGPTSSTLIACAALSVIAERGQTPQKSASDRHSPWRSAGGWRLNAPARHELALRDGDRLVQVTVTRGSAGQVVSMDGEELAIDASVRPGRVTGTVGGVPVAATVVGNGPAIDVFDAGFHGHLVLHDPVAEAEILEEDTGSLRAPMPGVVVDVATAPGADVRRGDALIVIEAMKVEHTIRAPADGTVEAIHFASGERVEEGAELLAFAAAG